MQRVVGFDGLRGVLAVYVMVGHMAPFAGLPDWIARLVSHGGAAVDMFFILSGFVIAQSLHRFAGQPVAFVMARAGRTMPAYIPVFLCAVFIQLLPTGLRWMQWIAQDNPGRAIWSEGWPAHGTAEIVLHLTMLHGMIPDGVLPDAWVSFLGAAWSLSTEWQFYLVALLVARTGVDVRAIARALIIIAIFGVIWEFAAPEPLRLSRAFLANKAHYFALGAASWVLLNTGAAAARFFGLVFGAVMLLVAIKSDFATSSAGKFLPPIVWTFCLAIESRRSLEPVRSLLCWGPIQWLGTISYSLYLVNEPVQKMIGLGLALAVRGDEAHFTAFWIPLAIAVPIAVAAMLQRVVERPAAEWVRRRLPSR